MLPSKAKLQATCPLHSWFALETFTEWSRFLSGIGILLLATFASPSVNFAQAPASRLIYPIGDYHVGKRLLFEGLTAAASHAFETSYRLSRTFNDQHGIDAVPSLCRNGQALYLAGDLPGALSNLNAGLSLAYTSRFWTSYVDQMPTVLRPIELSDGRIAWVVEQRASRLAIYPEAYPVAIGTQAILVEVNDPEKSLAVAYEPIWIDAIETFLSQAVALRTRNELLGPLVKQYELSKQLESMYSNVSPRLPELLQRCQNVCYAITLHGLGKAQLAKNLLEQNLTLDSGFDHPLTSIALLELSQIAIEEGNVGTAALRAGQASLLAARLNQIDVLADSLPIVTHATDVLNPGQGLSISEGVLRWADADFGLVYLTALSMACESAARGNNSNAFEANEVRFNRLARNKEIQLPHLQAAIHAAQIKHQQLKGNTMNAKNAWRQLVAIAIGDESVSPLMPKLLQATSIQIAMREGRVAKRVLMGELGDLVQRPLEREWIKSPWQSMVWDHLPLNELYSTLATNTIQTAKPEDFVQLLSDWHERQLRISNPLLERSLAFRAQMMVDPTNLPEKTKQELLNFQARYELLKIRRGEIQNRWDNFRGGVRLDGLDWTAEQHREWLQIANLANQQFQDYAAESASMFYIPRQQNDRLDFAATLAGMQEQEAILGFFHGGNLMWGYLLHRGEVSVWSIARPKQVDDQMYALLKESLAYADIPSVLRSLESPSDWTKIASELKSALLPPEISQRLTSVKRLSIVPHGKLWLLPFEMLVDANAAPADCWLSKVKLTYALSLKSAGIQDRAMNSAEKTLYVARPNFFSVESEVDSSLTTDLIGVLDKNKTTILNLPKENAASYPFPILGTDEVIIGSDLALPADGGAQFVKQREQTLLFDPIQFMEIDNPNAAFFLDIQDQTAKRIYSNPDLVGNWLQYQRHLGTDCVLWRQWPVNGESTAIFAKDFFDRPDQSTATALQASRLNLWEIELNTTQEPRFSAPTRRGNAQLLSGKMPIFWGGWKLTTNVPLAIVGSDVNVAERN